MQLDRLALKDFRGFTALDLQPHPRFNVLWGENASGKTNLLEAIFWLATLRPIRARLRELVRFEQPAASAEGWINQDGLIHHLAVETQGGERIAKREGKRVDVADYFGALAVILFTPEDVLIIRGPPADRRRLLDRAIFTRRPAYLSDVIHFKRALDARNRLLKEGAADAHLEAFEISLAAYSARLVAARQAYVEALAPRFQVAFSAIMGEEIEATLRYRPSLEAEAPAAFEAAWREDRPRDRQRGFTQRGPQLDDLSLRVQDRPARAFASQGQQRALILALKIAEIDLLQALARRPVLLLDDVSSELDPRRSARLFDFLAAFEGQVFITTTDRAFIPITSDAQSWRLSHGEVRHSGG
ncbi:DNA replication/repair protein RecF [Myxococcota bacterium]|nr:DNA replication/repair protein RecF [Myxococcota bacterium]MBU1430816.1 DNA replication/repair protein RecF [Myxococcota bacterium]MBU1899658.1 DNA replication/repair protein RecF [Myxococcota bacterium]